MAQEKKLKLVVIGPQATGKTQLINQYLLQFFSAAYETTIGIDFRSKQYETVKAQIWDTGGDERFKSLIPSYMRDASAVAVVLATKDRYGRPIEESTLRAQATNFYNLAKSGTPDGTPIYFVINKTDLGSDLTEDEIKEAEENIRKALAEIDDKIPVLFCSAKTGLGVKEAFNQMLARAYQYCYPNENIPKCFASSNEQLLDEPPVSQPDLLSSESPSFWQGFLDFLAEHKKLFIGNGVLIAAAIITLVILASLPLGGLPILAGLSALAVAGIAAGVALVVWNVAGIIGNLIFKDDGGGSGPSPEDGKARQINEIPTKQVNKEPTEGAYQPSPLHPTSGAPEEPEVPLTPETTPENTQQPK